MKRRLVGLMMLMLAASANAQSAKPEAVLEPPVWGSLERFRDDAEFMSYMRETRRAARSQGYYWALSPHVQFAQAGVCPDGSPPPCESAQEEDVIVVTGSRIASPAHASPTPSITNVQTLGVDEGDIVKQIGQYLIVLQDGRLFVIDTRPNGQPGMALTSRVDVYRDPGSDSWYDEMLVTPERVVVTGYSYSFEASEISVFSFSRRGVLAREATYYISSNDYYDSENYATRLVDGNLVIYTPLDLRSINPDRPVQWPLVRRWVRAAREDGDDPVLSRGTRLFDARNIYRPISRIFAPVVHSISVCNLGAARAGDELDCETRGFVGAGRREFLVSPTDAFLWVTPGDQELSNGRMRECDEKPGDADAHAVPATIFRLPLSGGAPTALFARGEPLDQFALDANGGEFRAVLAWNTDYCADNDETGLDVRYLHARLSDFDARPIAAVAADYARPPAPQARRFETRFTDQYVVYGGRGGLWGSYPPDEDAPRTSRIVAIPLATPYRHTLMNAPHDSMRIERVGDNIVISGYRDDEGLSVSMIDLRARPRLADTHVLKGRFESEGRSHAFNSIVDEAGAALMGLPTVRRTDEAGRWVWRSDASDVSFLTATADGRLASIGELEAREGAVDPAYECEVSCVDWYGNTRPIFTDGRVFALTGTELVEGAIVGGGISEMARLNLSATPPARSHGRALSVASPP